MPHNFDEAAANWDQQEYRVHRAQVLAQKILTLIQLPQAARILDFGCGTGLLGFNFADYAQELVLADTSKGMLEQVSQKIQAQNLKQAHPLNLATEELSGQFDLICSLMTLHHIEDYVATLETLAQHLSPKGYLCIIDLEQEDGSFHAPRVVPHNGFNPKLLADQYQQFNVQPIHLSVAFNSQKVIQEMPKTYPIFMLIGQKLAADF